MFSFVTFLAIKNWCMSCNLNSSAKSGQFNLFGTLMCKYRKSVILKQIQVICDISNTRKSVSSGYPNPEKWVEKTRRNRVFLTESEVFGYLMKHSFEFLIWLLKPFIILGEIQSKSLQDSMLIKIRYPNHRHGSDFLCFLFMNY